MPKPAMTLFDRSILDINAQEEVERIVEFLKQTVFHTLRRQGAVVGISGGIDSSVVLALCVRAFSPQRVVGILLPEKDSSPESVDLAQGLARQFSVDTVIENITPALEGLGCYARRDEAIRRVIPEYRPGWKAKIALSGNILDESTLNVFRLVITDQDGQEYSRRLPLNEFAQIVASSNLKQRSRMSLLYYHAELRNYAVIGTANKNEHALGFFVKYGDGGMDVNPIRHLFKTQVYQLAKCLDIPEEIQSRTPTTDTYPGGSTQEEFFYRIPFDLLDAIWLGYERGIPQDQIASGLGLSVVQVGRVVDDIRRKIHATEYLRKPIIHLDEED